MPQRRLLHTSTGRVRAVAEWLRAVHAPERLADKEAELGGFAAVACLITALFVAGTPAWDYAIDPAGALRSLGLRMAEAISILLLAALMWRGARRWPVRVGLFAVPAFVQVTFIVILYRLEGGASFGMGGFLYFFIFVPFMAMAQSLRFTVVLLGVIGLLPNLLVLGAGFGEHLELRVYNAYVWMVYPPVVGILLLLESLQYQLYRKRIQLDHYAHTDALTGLPNRRHFVSESLNLLAAQPGRGRSVSVLFVDADWFKLINDDYGHRSGDRALRTLAATIAESVRATDLVARYGGEEFVVLMPDTGPGLAREVAERIRRRVAETPLKLENAAADLHLTVSVGVASAEAVAARDDLRALLQAADDALYEAKRAGRNRLAVA